MVIVNLKKVVRTTGLSDIVEIYNTSGKVNQVTLWEFTRPHGAGVMGVQASVLGPCLPSAPHF